MNQKYLLQKVLDVLPWWLRGAVSWLLTLLPIAALTDPQILSQLLGHWGLPAVYIPIIVAKIIDVFSETPKKKLEQ